MSKIKKISSEPLGAFLAEVFIKFSKLNRWKAALKDKNDHKEFAKLVIEFSPDGYPICGNSALIKAIFLTAVFPDQIEPDSEDSRLFLVCYRRAPELVLALVAYFRAIWAKASKHRRLLLLAPNPEEMTPKAITAGVTGKVENDAAKKERTKIRKIAFEIGEKHQRAKEYIDKVLTENLIKPASFRPQSSEARKRRVQQG